jgi:hypothetical protein
MFSASMAAKARFLGIFAAILAKNRLLKALLRRYGHFKEYAVPA